FHFLVEPEPPPFTLRVVVLGLHGATAPTRAKLQTMTPMSARSGGRRRQGSRRLSSGHRVEEVRASSAVSTGVLPRFTTCFGPRTELAGLKGSTPSIRMAARCRFTDGFDRVSPSCSP